MAVLRTPAFGKAEYGAGCQIARMEANRGGLTCEWCSREDRESTRGAEVEQQGLPVIELMSEIGCQVGRLSAGLTVFLILLRGIS